MNNSDPSKTPLQSAQVCAGFPSPADDYLESRLDLNEFLIKHPAATFFVRASGDSMSGEGIHTGDILIVDKSLEPCSGNIVVAVVEGDFTVKTLRKARGRIFLVPSNELYRPIEITPEMNAEIWGVVTTVIRKIGR